MATDVLFPQSNTLIRGNATNRAQMYDNDSGTYGELSQTVLCDDSVVRVLSVPAGSAASAGSWLFTSSMFSWDLRDAMKLRCIF